MRLKFIEDTKNIVALKEALAILEARSDDLPGLGLVFGQAGLGKTRAVHWYHTQNGGVYLRAKAIWTPRMMLQEICSELEQDPEYQTVKVFNQVIEELLIRPRLMFVDEADYLCTNWKMLETLRDLHDITGAPIVLVGMAGIKSKLARHHQLWSRISQVVEFRPLSCNEVAFIAQELAGLNLPEDVVQSLTKATSGYFRDIMVALDHLEGIIRANPGSKVSSKMIELTSRKVLKQRAA